jgi:hypothetical protein
MAAASPRSFSAQAIGSMARSGNRAAAPEPIRKIA